MRMLHRSKVMHHVPMTETVERVYFAVLDESGRSLPAVEYWAGLIDDGAGLAVPMRRFVKLIGPDESLSEVESGVFQGTRSRRMYVRCPHARDFAQYSSALRGSHVSGSLLRPEHRRHAVSRAA